MAFTTADLDALDRAIASGELTIRSDAGSLVTYRSMSELILARDKVAGAIASSDSARQSPRHQLADFSDD